MYAVFSIECLLACGFPPQHLGFYHPWIAKPCSLRGQTSSRPCGNLCPLLSCFDLLPTTQKVCAVILINIFWFVTEPENRNLCICKPELNFPCCFGDLSNFLTNTLFHGWSVMKMLLFSFHIIHNILIGIFEIYSLYSEAVLQVWIMGFFCASPAASLADAITMHPIVQHA